MTYDMTVLFILGITLALVARRIYYGILIYKEAREVWRDLGLSHLSLPPIYVRDFGSSYHACDGGQDMIRIQISSTWRATVAHELRHAWQWRTGLIRVERLPNTAMVLRYWRDVPFLFAPAHQHCPWEQDAVRYENYWRALRGMRRRSGYGTHLIPNVPEPGAATRLALRAGGTSQ